MRRFFYPLLILLICAGGARAATNELAAPGWVQSTYIVPVATGLDTGPTGRYSVALSEILALGGFITQAQADLAYAPVTHAASHATGGADEITPAAIGAEVAGAAATVQGSLDNHAAAIDPHAVYLLDSDTTTWDKDASDDFSGDYTLLTNKPTLGTAAALDAGTAIGDLPQLVDDGAGNASLGIAGIDLPTGADYKVNGTALDVGDLTDTGGLLGGGGATAFSDLSDADKTGWSEGQTVKFDASGNLIPGDDLTAAGAGYVATPPTYSDESCTAGQYALSESYRWDCIASGNWNRTALTDWTNLTPDTTPDSFSFSDQVDVALSTEITSDPITVAGINTDTAITVTGGTYDINASGVFTADAGTVSIGDTVRARHTSSGTNSTGTDTVVTVGGVSDTFTSTTVAGGASVLGLNTVGTTDYTLYQNGNFYMQSFTASDSGSLTTGHVYTRTNGPPVKVCVYLDNATLGTANSSDTLVGCTAEIISVGNSWVSGDYSGGTITAGNNYWIGVVTNDQDVVSKYNTGGTTRYWGTGSTAAYSSPPADLSSAGSSSTIGRTASVYVEYQ